MKNHLTICYIAPEYFPVWGGTGSYSIQLIKNLPKNTDIHVVTLKRKIPETNDTKKNKPEAFSKENVHIHYISHANDTFIYNINFQLGCLRTIRKLHRIYHFDLIHSQHPHMPDILLQLSKTINIPTVSTVHNMFRWMRASIINQYDGHTNLDRSEKAILRLYPLLAKLESLYLSKINSLIAPSNECKNELVKHLQIPPDRIYVIHNGVDPAVFSPHCTYKSMLPNHIALSSRPVVLFTGRLIAQKGVNTLIDATPSVVKKIPTICFLFVGAGDFHPYYTRLRNYGVSDKNFINVGYIDYLNMPSIYSIASVFILPSPHENCSLSILEAMSSEKAVIAANVGGNSEIIQSYFNGVLFKNNQSDELAEKIIELVTNMNLRKQIGVQARNTVIDKFSVSKVASETLKVYERTIDNYRC